MKIQLEVFSTTKTHKTVSTWIYTTVESEALNKYIYGYKEPIGFFSDPWLFNYGADSSMREWIKINKDMLHELGKYFRYENDLDNLGGIMELFYDKSQHKLIYMTVKAI